MPKAEHTLENLRQQLARLELVASNILHVIAELENESPSIHRIADRDGNPIVLGSKVLFFLTKGRLRSTAGTVTRFSKNSERVFARDSSGVEVARAPYNVRVVINQDAL